MSKCACPLPGGRDWPKGESMKVVLYQPEIPQNTGNIGRLCVATETPLILVRPLGFHLDGKEIRRSGLDYWRDLDLQVVDRFDDIVQEHPGSRILLMTTKGSQSYTEHHYNRDDLLVFGAEGSGLPEELHQHFNKYRLSIPMWGPVRSLNLATSVGIVLYEAYRQLSISA